jgi:RHS repeat-associated protein
LSFYSYDGHGSVRQLTDASASVTDTYTYDAFGILTSRTGITPNDYLYSGQHFDQHLKLYYLRARYLNQDAGRFLSVDSYAGNQSDPGTLHKYLYTANDPINKWDKSGNFTTSQLVVTASIALLATIAVLPFATHFLSSGASNEPLIEIEDQPVILNGSGWDYGLAELTLSKAAEIWSRLARITVRSRPPIIINEECGTPGCLRNYLNDVRPRINDVKAILERNNVTAKHVTFFIGSAGSNVPGVTDTHNHPYPVYLGVSALDDGSTVAGSLTVAHEWGHSFGLHHWFIPNLMIFGPLASWGLQDSLTSEQRTKARVGAQTFR